MSADSQGSPASGSLVAAGAELRAERERLGLATADVAARLRLSLRQIEALETGDRSALPDNAFLRGFLRNYAKLLGLDGEQIVATAGMAVVSRSGVVPIYAPSQNIRFSSHDVASNRRMFAMASAIVGVALLIGLAWHFESSLVDVLGRARNSLLSRGAGSASQTAGSAATAGSSSVASDELRAGTPSNPAAPPARADGDASATPSPAGPEKVPASPAPAAVQTIPTLLPAAAGSSSPPSSAPASTSAASTPSTSPTSAATTSAPAAVPPTAAGSGASAADAASIAGDAASGHGRIRLSFDDDAWVEIRNAKGRKVYSKLHRSGEEEEVEVSPPVALVIGNARSVHMNYNGRSVDLLPHIKVSVARLTLEP